MRRRLWLVGLVDSGSLRGRQGLLRVVLQLGVIDEWLVHEWPEDSTGLTGRGGCRCVTRLLRQGNCQCGRKNGLARNRRSKGGANPRGGPEKMGRIGMEESGWVGQVTERKKTTVTHLCILKVSHETPIDEALIEDVDEGVVLDMGSKGKMPVRCFHAPFFLELGGSLSVVCEAEMVSKLLMEARGPGEEC